MLPPGGFPGMLHAALLSTPALGVPKQRLLPHPALWHDPQSHQTSPRGGDTEVGSGNESHQASLLTPRVLIGYSQ